jgi:parallel beta-helix repeat protein
MPPLLSLKSFSRFLILLLILQLSIGFFAFPVHQAKASGTTYYVDNTCTYNGNGLAQTCASSSGAAGPFNSIANAQSAVTGNQSGNSVLLKDGDTFREQYSIPAYGTSGSPFTIGNYGTGALPIISGANLVTSWTATSSAATGSVTQTNMRLSTINGTAFVDFNASGTLTPYIGDQITITDSTGHQLVGYIKAAGTGETYGSELLPNPGMDTIGDFSSYDAALAILTTGCQSGNCLQVTNTSGGSPWGIAWQVFSASAGMLLRSSAYVKEGTETVNWTTFYVSDNSNSTLNQLYPTISSSWIQEVLYATADDTGTGFRQYYGAITNGLSTIWDTAIAEQVLTPSTTGATIVSAPGGSTYNWTSEASGFNVNDSNGYTYSIVASTTLYYASYSTAPNQVFEDGTRLTQETTGASSLFPGQWFLDTVNSRIWVYLTAGDAPSGHTMEASQRSYGVYSYGPNNSYITISSLEVTDAQTHDVYVQYYSPGNSNIVVSGVTTLNAYDMGIRFEGVSNGTISSCVAAYNGSTGVMFWDSPSLLISQCTVHNNDSLPPSTGADWTWNGGIHGGVETTGQWSTNVIVQDNSVYSNGTMTGLSSGSGIVLDTIGTGALVQDNFVCNNTDIGINIDADNSATVANNIVCDSGNYGILLQADGNTTMTGHKAYGNTLWGNATAGLGVLGYISGYANSCTSILVKNNIVINSAGGPALQAEYGCENPGTDGSGNVYSYNDFGPNASNFIQWGSSTYYSTLAAWQAASGQTNNLNSNPLFISTSTDNFALQSSSPAIDAGLNLGSTYEYGLDPASTWPSSVILDNQNNYGSGWEMGAYVYTQTSTPSVAMTAPANLATVSSTVTISASSTAVSPATISSVQFYLDGSPLGSPITSTSSANTYSYSWNTALSTNASHTLYALATDNYNNTATSTSIMVTVANQAVLSVPTSTLSFSAAHGSTATSSQSIVVTNNGGAYTTLNWSATSTQPWLTFSRSSSSITGGASTSVAFVANPTGLAIGAYNAAATISDPNASSSPQTVPVSFTISTTGIGTSITSPASGSTVSGNVTIAATATSTAGIASVQFYLDGSPLSSVVTSSPYTVSWNTDNATNGYHTLSTLATDNDGNTATSSAVTVTVDNVSPSSVTVDVAAGYAVGSAPASTPTITTTTPITISRTSTSSAIAVLAANTTSTLIATLEGELQTLIKEAAAQGINTPGATGSSPSASPNVFTRNLGLWDYGADVQALQQFLISQASGPAAAKLKAHGTSQVFGYLTYNALVEFQKVADITPASGYFGPKTRAYIISLAP